MNNLQVQNKLRECFTELLEIKKIPPTQNEVKYLYIYAVIKVSGTIEYAYKNIIADYCVSNACSRTMQYINSNIRDSSSNPTLENIYKLLNRFDNSWNTSFKLNKEYQYKQEIENAFKSIVDLRNSFAHGNSCSATIRDIIRYFIWMRYMMIRLDKLVGESPVL